MTLCRDYAAAKCFNWQQVTKENAKGTVKSETGGLKSEVRGLTREHRTLMNLQTSDFSISSITLA